MTMPQVLVHLRQPYFDPTSHQRIDEANFTSFLKKPLAGRANAFVTNKPITMAAELMLLAKAKGANLVATTDPRALKMLMEMDRELGEDARSDFQGSIIERFGMKFLILPPINHCVKLNWGTHIYERYLAKFTSAVDWVQIPQFKWELFEPKNADDLYEVFRTSTFISFDIETSYPAELRAINCIGLSAVHVSNISKSYTIRTVVIPLDDMYNVAFMRKLLQLPNPKVSQNGKYDIAHLLRYNSAPINWAFDTLDLFHSWYSELPKDLGFLAGYMLNGVTFWKDFKGSAPFTMGYFEYNAKDAFYTAVLLVALLLEMPPWALENYKMKFPVNFPCILAETFGEKVDFTAMYEMKEKLSGTVAKTLAGLQRMVASPYYNPASPTQTKLLFEALGCKDIKATGKVERDKVSARHSINKRLMKAIKTIREDRKLGDTYLVDDKAWGGRIYYALNPSGTDTGRLASRESAFWCGLQFQNIPRDRDDIQIKDMFISDAGFYHGEADGEQAEARDTAYISGDKALIAAVEGDRDFHAVNASSFFGLPYDSIVDGTTKKVINKPIRQISKNTNHGANYNMTAPVLLDTMGIENVIRAKALLKLPEAWSLMRVCQYLLDQFDKTYPVVRGDHYVNIIRTVAATSMLRGATGWTRYCFGHPEKSKPDLNAYAAHVSQSLNAQWLNKGYLKVFTEVWQPNKQDFKLGPQIHDSIKFQYRIGRQDLARKVKTCMEAVVIPVTDTYGITRQLKIPCSLKGEHTVWSKLLEEKDWTSS